MVRHTLKILQHLLQDWAFFQFLQRLDVGTQGMGQWSVDWTLRNIFHLFHIYTSLFQVTIRDNAWFNLKFVKT